MRTDLIELLYAAAAKPIGLLIETSDPLRLRQALYQARASMNDPALDDLSFIVSPYSPTGQLFVMRNKENSDAEAGPPETYPAP